METNQKFLATVIPPESLESGATRTQGTRVVLDDGTELTQVTGIILEAQVNSLWHGTITCHPKMGVMKGMTVHIQYGKASWWRTLLCRLAGVLVEESHLDLIERRYRAP